MRLLRRFPLLIGILAATTIGLARPAAAVHVAVLHSTMLGSNEVPGPGDPNASGSTTIVLNSASGSVCYVIHVAGLSAPLTAAHIHIGPTGVAGPVVIPLPLTGGPNNFAGCTTANSTLIQRIIDNPSGYYTNVHNAPFPAGVERGQLSSATAVNVAVLRSTMLGSNEVPGPGDPNASGSTTIVLNSASGSVCYVIHVAGLSAPLTAAHIHIGPTGVAGPVVIPLPLTGGPDTFAGCTTANSTLIQKIIDNPSGYYTNVHNAPFPAGVERGQLS
jgi:hypothetical protein